MQPVFLTLDEILAIHEDQIARYGGSLGVRDWGLLQSATAMPAVTFGGRFLHGDLCEMAAAYLFHLVQNHPFVDGNTRTAPASALVFLDLNGVELQDPQEACKKEAAALKVRSPAVQLDSIEEERSP